MSGLSRATVTDWCLAEHIVVDFLERMSGPVAASAAAGAATPMAASTVGTTTIHYGGGKKGLLLFAKAQVAKDLSLGLRQFAARDGTFPRYSTADQLLRREQFSRLVELGGESGLRLRQEIEELRVEAAEKEKRSARP